MTDLSRRSMAAGAGLLVGAFYSGARGQQLAGVATAPRATPKPLTFNPEKVKGLSAELLRAHHGKDYTEAVKRLNAIGDELATLDFAAAPPDRMSALKRDEQSTYNATILHELYFDGIGEGPSQPAGLLAQAMLRDFGSLERWKAEFVATARTLLEGSGWVVMAFAPREKRLFNHWAGDDSIATAGTVPLLALDMHTHAYELDYGKDAPKYVDAYLEAIRWTNAERLYREAMRL